MATAEASFVSGLVLAAGGSRRLGRPKQSLPYGATTLLGHVLDTARACTFDQLLCTVGGGGGRALLAAAAAGAGADAAADLAGVEIVDNPHYGSGCSSSIAAALGAVDPRCDVLVLLLGDQPGVRPATVAALLRGRGRSTPFAVCRYADGRGHPFAFGRAAFGELAALHGDKAVWSLLDQHAAATVEVPIAGPVPLDVDTWEDYAAVLAAETAPA